MKKPHCAKCGKPLSDPVSIRLGMGPECRGDSGRGRSYSKGQRRQNARVARSVAFGKGEPVSVGDMTWEKEPEGKWRDQDGMETDHETLHAWLMANELIVADPERKRVRIWEIELRLLGRWYNAGRFTGTRAEFAAFWKEHYKGQRARARVVKDDAV